MWIARNNNEKNCVLFVNKPTRLLSGIWYDKDAKGAVTNKYGLPLPKELFQAVTWEGQPVEVQLIIK